MKTRIVLYSLRKVGGDFVSIAIGAFHLIDKDTKVVYIREGESAPVSDEEFIELFGDKMITCMGQVFLNNPVEYYAAIPYRFSSGYLTGVREEIPE
jgi:hypothetical protein